MTQSVCFDSALADQFLPGRVVAAVVMAVGAVLMLFVVPWLLGTQALKRVQSKRATAGAWSLAVNSAALVFVCFVLRHTVGVDRTGFLVAWLAWTAVLSVLAREEARCGGERRPLCRRWGIGLLVGVVAVTLGIVLFHREHFVQCFNGDGTEFCDLAQSLRHHFLPYWEIETAGRFGTFVANPTVINSYWTLALQLLLGVGEVATRLPCWIWWLAAFAVSLRMVQGEECRGAWLSAIPLALMLLLISLWYTFYVGYYPYMADPANPAVPDALFTLLLLLALDCLRRGDCAGWVVLMILASLVFYAGLVMFLLMAAAAWIWRPVPRWQVSWATPIGMLVLAGIVGAYLLVGLSEGSLSGWWGTLQREVVRKYSSPGPQYAASVPAWSFSLLFVGYFLLGCGGIPAIGLLRGFWRRDADRDSACDSACDSARDSARDNARDNAWDRTVTTVTLVYLLIIIGSGHKNLHYLGPLLPMPIILWLKNRQGAPKTDILRSLAPLSATGSLAVCIFLCWPVTRPTFTLNRQLGAVTTFQTDSYEEACRWGRIALELYRRGDLGWQLGEHTWASYSQRSAGTPAPRPFVVTDGAAPSGEYQLVFESAEGVKLFGRDPQESRWLKNQQPSTGADRCPAILQPIAIIPRPRQVAAP